MILNVSDVLIGMAIAVVVFAALGAVLLRFNAAWTTVMDVIGGIVGITMLLTFLGILIWWIKAPPLIIIVIFVVLLLLYDWLKTLQYGESR
jgi:hypothetical protein